ncbi:MAG: PEP-CTERM sorting domain-containing protein, partial [Phycisphaerae bacterium]|nr:PEP-CTERM sorting domain-containing protein [Phycisphaerae bacterium]
PGDDPVVPEPSTSLMFLCAALLSRAWSR